MVLMAPTYEATWDDMQQPFEKFIERVEEETWHYGVCVIIPPPGWTARAGGYSDLQNWPVPKPIKQYVTGTKGVYQSVHVEHKNLMLSEFQVIASAPENQPPARCLTGNVEDLERAFWKNLTHSPPLYGADGVGSLFDDSIPEWNVGKLDSLLSRTLQKSGLAIPGVTTSYLYFGMWRSLFAWHTEDVDLYSVNYLHFGEPKSWYIIPPAHRERFERLAQGLVPQLHKLCPEFLRHKETLMSPQLLQQHSIPLIRAVQQPGQFVINFPGVYHAGFNHGFNCAESTNFATKRWLALGARAKACGCTRDSVTIDMNLFADPFVSLPSDIPSLGPSTPEGGPKKRPWKGNTTGEAMKKRKNNVDLSRSGSKAEKKPLLLKRRPKGKRKSRFKGAVTMLKQKAVVVRDALATLRVRHVSRDRRTCGLQTEVLIRHCLTSPINLRRQAYSAAAAVSGSVTTANQNGLGMPTFSAKRKKAENAMQTETRDTLGWTIQVSSSNAVRKIRLIPQKGPIKPQPMEPLSEVKDMRPLMSVVEAAGMRADHLICRLNALRTRLERMDGEAELLDCNEEESPPNEIREGAPHEDAVADVENYLRGEVDKVTVTQCLRSEAPVQVVAAVKSKQASYPAGDDVRKRLQVRRSLRLMALCSGSIVDSKPNSKRAS